MLNRKLLTAIELRCRMPIDAFRTMGDTIDTEDGQLTFIDRGGDTLAVAHLDFVDWTRPRISRSGETIRCPQLDDRLGAWTILDLLPTLGIHSDILLTDSEEIGRSTAQHFRAGKQYNWIFQFDRRGTDAVLYHYDSDENRNRLEHHGFTIGRGSFSDICYLDLDCSGWNIGTGYHHEHSRRCYARLSDTFGNAVKLAEFWREHHGEHIPPPVETVRGYLDWGGPARTESEFSLETWECVCGQVMWLMDPYCEDCGRSYDDLEKLGGWSAYDDRTFYEILESEDY
ncbi:hypothetical protein SH661x_001823 [Planctomicrobium sp. SH661]|uniref:hypothetical protein n=1 Tax=Planctomicrobium sp. SH661 TaxID=3448124 RepID=UPI003F5BF0F9